MDWEAEIATINKSKISTTAVSRQYAEPTLPYTWYQVLQCDTLYGGSFFILSNILRSINKFQGRRP